MTENKTVSGQCSCPYLSMSWLYVLMLVWVKEYTSEDLGPLR